MKNKLYWKVAIKHFERGFTSVGAFGNLEHRYFYNKWTVGRNTHLGNSYGLCIFSTRKNARRFGGNVKKCKVGKVWEPKVPRLINAERAFLSERPVVFRSGWPTGTLMTDKVMLLKRSH